MKSTGKLKAKKITKMVPYIAASIIGLGGLLLSTLGGVGLSRVIKEQEEFIDTYRAIRLEQCNDEEAQIEVLKKNDDMLWLDAKKESEDRWVQETVSGISGEGTLKGDILSAGLFSIVGAVAAAGVGACVDPKGKEQNAEYVK